jgi:hypothetical protein
MSDSDERRTSRRFNISLPLTVRTGTGDDAERQAQTRDVSYQGLYFLMDEDFDAGSSIEIILTLPREMTQNGDVNIRCFAKIVRVEEIDGRYGVAARIERYEFLPTAA